MIRAEVVGSLIKISFKYTKTDYCNTVINKLKSFGAMWNPNTKTWSLPAAKKQEFNDKFKQYLIAWENDAEIKGGGIDENSIPDTPIVPGYTVKYNEDEQVVESTGWKVPPIAKYQVRGFNTIVDRSFLILADEMGLGKTHQVITAIEAKKKLGQLSRGVIVCKASLLYNWYDEVLKFTDLKPIIMEGTQYKRHQLHAALKHDDSLKWDVIIVSYETYRVDCSNFNTLDNKKSLD